MDGEGCVVHRVLEGKTVELGEEARLKDSGEVAIGQGEGGVVVEAQLVAHHVEELCG